MAFLLHKWASGWGLPSISPACTCVEMHLRLAGVEVMVQEYDGARRSPSGQLPALERGDELVDGGSDEDSCAAAIAAYLAAHGHDLDAHLGATERSELAAFSALVRDALEPATAAALWAERHSYAAHTRPAYGAGLPLPLSLLLPWARRRAGLQRLGALTPAQAYRRAGKAYEALEARLRASADAGGRFVLGRRACSLDARLCAHLLHHRFAPVSPPELRHEARGRPVHRVKLERHPALVRYVERMLADVFGAPLPAAPAVQAADWGPRAEPGAAPDPPDAKPWWSARSAPKSAEEEERVRNNWRWLGGVGVIAASYILFSAGMFTVVSEDEEYYEDDDFELVDE